MILLSDIEYGMMGHCVADALGVPYEFKTREEMDENPATDMAGYGTYNKPPGTWSDDTSMTLATAESLALYGRKNIDYSDMMDRFVSWIEKGEYTSDGDVFDVGGTTRYAITKYTRGNTRPYKCGSVGERDNGNGSLMRMLPIAAFLYSKTPWRQLPDKNGMVPLYPEDLEEIFKASSLTHAHPRSKIACAIYCLIAGYLFLMKGCSLASQVSNGISFALGWCERLHLSKKELSYYKRLEELVSNEGEGIKKLSRDEIKSSGYVVSTLEAAIWCLLNHNNYKDTVLAAINLGGDTDTIAAICGGLAGIYYGDDPKKGIPKRWINKIRNKEEVIRISRDLDEVLWINTRLPGNNFLKGKIDSNVLRALKAHRIMPNLEVEDPPIATELKVALCFSEKEYRMMTIGVGDYEPGYDSQGLCLAKNNLYFFEFIHGERKIHFFAPMIKEKNKYHIRKICLCYIPADKVKEIDFCCGIIYGFFLKKDVSFVKHYVCRHKYNESSVLKVWHEFGADY